jgi:hypothetical protein
MGKHDSERLITIGPIPARAFAHIESVSAA